MVCVFLYVAIIGMLFTAKNELKQYLTSINPICAKYTEGLWADEVNSAAQLGSQSCMHMIDIYDRNAVPAPHSQTEHP